MADDPRIPFARELRQRQTLAEATLWKSLRGGRLDGLKWRRQHAIGPYYADFACEALRLIVELDGGVHDADEQIEKDLARQEDLERLGWLVIRFPNADVHNRLPQVLDAIRAQARLAGRVTPHPPADQVGGPLPLPLGEG